MMLSRLISAECVQADGALSQSSEAVLMPWVRHVQPSTMVRLAKKLRPSDRELAKACARANVPVPGRGYWAKLRHGKKVPRLSLPPIAAGAPACTRYARMLLLPGRLIDTALDCAKH